MQGVKKIGILMYGLLGDVLMRTPVINEIRNRNPNSDIYIFVDPIGKEIIKYN